MNTIALEARAPFMPFGRLLRAYFTDAKYEALRMLRAPAFAIPLLLIPAPVYLLMTSTLPHQALVENPRILDFLFISFSVMAVMGPALFGAGTTLATERDAGLMKLKRAQPAPAGSYLLAKMVMSIFFAALAMGIMTAAALWSGSTHFTAVQLVLLSATMMAGALPFCALGLFIGAYCSGSAAPGVANLVYFPMLYLGGLFFPLPAVLQRWVVIWPASHLNQVAVAVVGLSKFQFFPPQISLAVLLGVTVVFGGLAVRRLARVG
jgi:ABC-2 type transport system permease protein